MDLSVNIRERLYKIDKKFEGKDELRKLVGIGFILLGIIGGLLPIIQGWIFILLGGYLLFGDKFIDFLKKIIGKFRGE